VSITKLILLRVDIKINFSDSLKVTVELLQNKRRNKCKISSVQNSAKPFTILTKIGWGDLLVILMSGSRTNRESSSTGGSASRFAELSSSK